MTEYNKRGSSSRGDYGNKASFGARSGGKPSFVKKSFGDRRPSDGPVTQFQATCSNCGNSCAVPFKPVNGKPVFCRDCFVKTGETGAGRAGDKFPRKEFQPRPSYNASPVGDSSAAVLKQLEKMNANLEKLIAVVEKSVA